MLKPSPKQIVFAVLGVLALVIICVNPRARERNHTHHKAADTGPKVSREDLLVQSFKRAQVEKVDSLKEETRRLYSPREKIYYSKNGGWLPQDTASMPSEDGFLVYARFSPPLLAKALLLNSCGSFSKSRRCSEDELSSRLEKNDVCSLLSGAYYVAYDQEHRRLLNTDKMRGHDVAHCEEFGAEVHLLLGPFVSQPRTFSISEEGPEFPLTVVRPAAPEGS